MSKLRAGFRFAAFSLVLAIVCLPAIAPAAAGAAEPPINPQVTTDYSCPAEARLGFARCYAIVRTDPGSKPNAAGVPSGFGPSDLRSAYSAPSSNAGQLVAIVDAYDDPNAEKDLATYRSYFGLPACTTANGCFKKVDQNGGTSFPTPDAGWTQELSLDLDMVSALCPNCHILLVEASSSNLNDLGAAVNTAAKMGARVISNSYGGDESSGETGDENSYYNHPGVALTVSSGDNGYSVQFPAASRYVTAVGGTSLKTASNSRGWAETAWNGAGSGCSAYVPKPTWQHDTGCARRTVADVAAVADPQTGVAVYDSYKQQGSSARPALAQSGWLVMGGTSVAAPIIGAIYALAGNSSVNYGSLPYARPGSLNDVTSGSNGSCNSSYLCTAGTGYDGPTGLGTPIGVAAFQANTTSASVARAVPTPLGRPGYILPPPTGPANAPAST